MIHAFASADFIENVFFLVLAVRWDDPRDGRPQHLARGIPENLFSTFIPARDDAVQVLADDGVVGKSDNRRLPANGQLGLVALRDVTGDSKEQFRLRGLSYP